ncbi:transposable element Tcb1 transposase [Trichonephila clavipes]|nr:transposable element Tcb1 transposase [Trichonephila clavipes]
MTCVSTIFTYRKPTDSRRDRTATLDTRSGHVTSKSPSRWRRGEICKWLEFQPGHTSRESGLSARRPLLGLPLMQSHRRLRRQWCDERRMCAAEWNEVVFTDESRICLQHRDGRIRVWRHRGEKDAEQLRYAP